MSNETKLIAGFTAPPAGGVILLAVGSRGGGFPESVNCVWLGIVLLILVFFAATAYLFNCLNFCELDVDTTEEEKRRCKADCYRRFAWIIVILTIAVVLVTVWCVIQ
jgi:hypothetical protein